MTRLEIPNVEQFLENRATTVEELQSLLNALENPQTRTQACGMLHQLANSLHGKPGKNGLGLHVMPVPGSETPITLLLHPAVFAPEQWGRTFAEGLLKDPEVFNGKDVVELGAGSGWISVLLLMRTSVKSVLGLDINPIAVLIAKLNIWLNGSTADGTLLNTPHGLPLVKSFRAELSDLLGEPLQRHEKFDHVIGCIPQVLHPDPAVLTIKKRLSNKDLYDLSNYCFQQGILEDRFGLPLIARALEQAQLCLNPNGLVTLILGGRPGQEAIDGVFRRRGYKPKLWWSRRIQQADDTDLASLVELEKIHGIKFHFFSSHSSKHSIPASTAVRLLEHDKPLFHDLLVYQAGTRFEKPTLGFVKNVEALGMSSIRKELDFSRVSDEQVSFLEKLTADFLKDRTIPYPHERGDVRFREKLARFLNVYCNYLTNADDLFVGPERSQLVFMILSMVTKPGDKVLLSSSVESEYSSALQRLGCEVILGNDDLSELMEMDNLFKPKMCILSPYQMGDPSPLLLQAFIQQAKAHPENWYLVDDSANFDIASELKSNVLMRIIGQHDIPANLVFMYGLIKNTVCPDLQLTFMINAPHKWIEGLDVATELTYSRIAYPTQLYYEWLFDELLSFPFAQEDTIAFPKRAAATATLEPAFQEIARDPVFAPKPISLDDPDLIRFDYGENEAAVPTTLVKGLIKGFLDDPSPALPGIVASRVASYMKFTRHATVEADRVVLAQGVFPLFGSLIQVMRQRLGRPPVVALPHGTYGLIYPLIRYHGGIVHEIDTDAEQGFRPSVQSIARLSEKPDLLWLTQPNNPSGLFFDSDTVAGIMQLCAERGIYILADEIFFLLSDPDLGAWTPPQLSFGSHMNGPEGKFVFVVDGLAKAFAAGGLRCGFMVCPDAGWTADIQNYTPLPPNSTLRAWDALYSAFLEEAPHHLIDLAKEQAEVLAYLTDIRISLAQKRQKLLALLKSFGVDDGLTDAKRGGLFVLAKLAQRASELAREKKVLINPDQWSRTPGWSRVCFSIGDDQFNEALMRLAEFLGVTKA